MLTTDGSTFAAMPAYDVGTTLNEPDGSCADGSVAVEPFPWSSAAPTPTPIPPKTRAEAPAAAAVTRHPVRERSGWGCSGAVGADTCTGGQHRSVMTPRVSLRSERILHP